MKFRSITAILAGLLVSATLTFADATIGNGFTCSGDNILKGGREIKFSKAKSTLAKTIEKLKTKLSNIPKKNKAKRDAVKAQIAAANNSKTLLKACTSGQLAPDQVDPIFTQLAAGDGTYAGDYTGSALGGLLQLSGPISMQFILEGTQFSAILTIGGNVGTSLNAQPLTFSGDVGGIGFPAQFVLSGTFLGEVTLNITQGGLLSITNLGNANPVTFEGQFPSTTITSSLAGTYNGVTFSGNATLIRD
jgi:hypothetical protein